MIKIFDFVKTSRFGEIAITTIVLLIITIPIWLSPFHPAIVTYIIISYDVYFLLNSLKITYYATIAYKKILLTQSVPFFKKIEKDADVENIKHFIIIPNYKEPIYKLEATIKALSESDYPYKDKLFLVLAFEKREESEAEEKAFYIKRHYGSFFANIITTYHVLTDKEVPGKASNQAFSAKEIEKYVIKNEWKFEDILITICDADSILPKNFFSYVSYQFIKDIDRLYHFYWAPVLLYNNFWDLPFFVRIQATLSSITRLALLEQKEKLIQISTYTTNLWLLKEVGYWDVDIVPEDWHIFFQAFFKFGNKVRTLPLYTFVNGDAVYAGGFFKTFLARYDQERRWAWGVTDLVYSWEKFFITPNISVFVKLKRMFFLAETHVQWPSSFFLLMVSGFIPPILNPEFSRSVLGFISPQISGSILTFSSILLIVYIYLDISVRNKLKIENKTLFLPFLVMQWYILPIVSFVLSTVPALDAHTKLLLGKKLVYKVTEKV